MVNFNANAIITAIDRASPVFAKVAASARMMTRSMSAANTHLAGASRTLAGGLAMGGAGLGGFALAAEYQVSKLTNQIKIFGDISEAEYGRVHAAAKDAAAKYGIPLREMLEGTRDLIQGGIPENAIAGSLDILGAAAARNHEPISRMADMLIRTARVMGFPMRNAKETAEALTRAADMLGTAPLISTESTSGFFEALKFIAPMGRVVGMSEAEMAAWNATMADLGFPGEEGGAGLRTILARLVSLTPKARAAIRGEGIDIGKVFSMDEARLYNIDALRERLAGANLFLEDGAGLARFAKPSGAGVQDWRDRLLKYLSEALGITKGDVENRKALTAVVEQHIASAISKVDLERALEVIARADSSLYTDQELAGKQRLQILEQLKNNTELYRQKLAEYTQRHKDSTRKGVKQLFGTLAFEMNRVASNWSIAVDSLFESGGKGGLAAFFKTLADGLGDLSRADPQVLSRLALGLGALVALPGASFAVSSIAGSVGQLAGGLAALGAAFMRAPILGKLLFGGGLLALGDLDQVFQRQRDAKGLPIEGSSPVEETLRSLGSLAGEAGGAVGDLYAALRELFGFDGRSSLLVDSLRLVNFLADTAATSLKYWRENAPAIAGGKFDDIKPPGEEGSWWRQSWEAWEGQLMKGLRRPLDGGALKVEGDVKGNMDVRLRIEAPPGFRAYIEDKRGGEIKGKLNTGETMPDAGGR